MRSVPTITVPWTTMGASYLPPVSSSCDFQSGCSVAPSKAYRMAPAGAEVGVVTRGAVRDWFSSLTHTTASSGPLLETTGEPGVLRATPQGAPGAAHAAPATLRHGVPSL